MILLNELSNEESLLGECLLLGALPLVLRLCSDEHASEIRVEAAIFIQRAFIESHRRTLIAAGGLAALAGLLDMSVHRAN